MSKYGNSAPDRWNFIFFKSFICHCILLSHTISTSIQPSSTKFVERTYAQKRVFGEICPNMVIRSQTPEILYFSKISASTVFYSFIQFQRAFNHLLQNSLSRLMSRNVFWGKYAQIWLWRHYTVLKIFFQVFIFMVNVEKIVRGRIWERFL